MDFHYKILVVEDDPSMSHFIHSILEPNGYEVIIAMNGIDAELMANSHCPDVILLDLSLPDIDGIDVLCSMRKWTDAPVIVVSSRNMEDDKVCALESGADDFIGKPFGDQELLARIRVALRHARTSCANAQLIQNSRFQVGELVIDYDKHRVFVGDRDVGLTQNEFRLVALLGQYVGKVLPYDVLIRKLWGPNAKGDNQILRVNMANIRRKIERDPSKPVYIITENGVGYRLVENSELDK